MNHEDLRWQCKIFAARIIELVQSLPKDGIADVLGQQLLQCGTRMGARYIEACKAASVSDFVLGIRSVEKEADEALYWLELLTGSKRVDPRPLLPIASECEELLGAFARLSARARSLPQSRQAGAWEAVDNLHLSVQIQVGRSRASVRPAAAASPAVRWQ